MTSRTAVKKRTATQGKTAPVKAVKKTAPAQGSTSIPDVDVSAVNEMTKKVKRAIADNERYWGIALPLIQHWHSAIQSTVQARGGMVKSAEFASEYKEGMSTAGSLYQNAQGLSRDLGEKGKDLLHFLWRLSFNYNAVGDEIRSDIANDFGLINAISKTVNQSQLARLNASQHRPLCVAEGILTSKCPRKRDATLASFANELYDLKYTFVNPDGATITLTPDNPNHANFIYMFIESRWSELVDLTSVGAMLKVWESIHGVPLGLKTQKSKVTQERREDTWIEAILPKAKKSMIDLSNASINADKKDEIASKVHDALDARFPGFALIRPSSCLHPLAILRPIYQENDKGENFLQLAEHTTKQLELALESATRLIPYIEAKLKVSKAQDAQSAVTTILEGLTDDQKADLIAKLTAS